MNFQLGGEICIRINYFGLLANVNENIVKVKLKNGFEIRSIPIKEVVELINILEDRREEYYIKEELMKIYKGYTRPDMDRTDIMLYFIYNSFEIGVDESPYNPIKIFKPFDNFKILLNQIYEQIQKMRLFKEGDIDLSYELYYYDEDNPKAFFRPVKNILNSFQLYSLELDEIDSLNEFINGYKWYFEISFLRLAYENYNISYKTNNLNLKFLSLMNGIETLLVREKVELSYSLSRNVAILLGDDRNDSEEIFIRFKKLYGKRSDIVHSGSAKISMKDIRALRLYLRRLILKINEIIGNKDYILTKKASKLEGMKELTPGKNYDKNIKKNLLFLLTSYGFGDQWRI